VISSAEPVRIERRKAALGTADGVIAAAIFCAAVALGAYAVMAFRAGGGAQYFYQAEFGPAVMMACGRGFLNPETDKVPALAAFLSQQTDALDCAGLPPAIPLNDLDPYQRVSRYLELTVALIWKMTGVSWSRLVILPGVLFGAVAALNYGVFRLGLSRVLALLGMIPILMSTGNLMLVPHVRDYAKGPFLLSVILIMGLLVAGATDQRRAIALSALAGAVVGLGLGFRTDLLTAFPPFLITVAFLLPRTVSIRARAAAIAIFLVSFGIVASPILAGYSKGSNTGHVVLLGLMKPFDQPLRIEPSIYEFGSQYNDSLAFALINSYAVRVEQRNVGDNIGTAEYDRTALKYLGNVATVFPADLVTRTLAATRATPRFFLDYLLYPPTQVQSEFGRMLYRIRARIWSRLAKVTVVAIAAATILIGMVNPRAAWLVVVVMIGFAGASAVQFNERHFYYLEVVPWWAFGLLAETGLRAPVLWQKLTMVHVKRAAIICGIVSAAAGSVIAASRIYQQRAAARLLESYETAPRRPLSVRRRAVGNGQTLITTEEWQMPLPPDLPRVVTRYLRVQFRDDLCGPSNLPVTIRYQAIRPELDFSEPIAVRLNHEPSVPTTLFFATYDRLFLAARDRGKEAARFRGIEVAADRVHCVDRLFQVESIDRTPLLLTTILMKDWRHERLYQRLR
jgi:hypothetical protein